VPRLRRARIVFGVVGVINALIPHSSVLRARIVLSVVGVISIVGAAAQVFFHASFGRYVVSDDRRFRVFVDDQPKDVRPGVMTHHVEVKLGAHDII
jgi:hypothetical protein